MARTCCIIMAQTRSWTILFALALFLPVTSGFVEGLYCGTLNCYDVLQIGREASRQEISKSYRKLARLYHPDVSNDADADQMFRLIATAYEILRDEESRKNYDYMLDNPEEAYYHYYRYYKHKMAPKVDVRIVIGVTITILSILQYLHKSRRYEEAVKYAMQNPKFRNQALQIIHQDGLLDKNKKAKNKRTKDEMRQEEEKVLREVVESSIDIRGGYSKPTFQDILWIQLLCSPYYLYKYIFWNLTWILKYWICKREYGSEDKEYLTYHSLGLSQNYWGALDNNAKMTFINRELWISENLKKYKKELEDEQRVKMAESGRYKMWRRYMRSGGPGRMTFAED